MFSLKYVLELSIESFKIEDDNYIVDFADEKFEKVVSILRLFKKGWVDYPFILERIVPTLTSELMQSMKISKRRVINIAGISPVISYKLSKEEVEEFKKFYQRVNKKIDCSRVSLKRFNETYLKTSVEDKLIDYIISFE